VIATANALTVDVLTAGDWPAVSAIYAEGIATRNATFETTVPSWDEWACAHMGHHRLVGRVDDEVVGWAALSRVSTRQCYRGVVEDSVYIRRGHRGQGVGHALLSKLVAQAEAAGIWTIEAGVFPENLASLRLHVACGFRVVGVRERIGQLDGAWRDVVFLERRSKEIA
jgi:L-amino acid N-acyltransferase YncA